MTPATYDFDVVRGSSGATQGLIVRLKTKDLNDNIVTMLFDDVRLSIYDKPAKSSSKTLLVRASISGDDDVGFGALFVTDEYEGEVSWEPHAADTRALKIGAKNHYELEVRHGTEEVVYLLGTITDVGGLNDDENAS